MLTAKGREFIKHMQALSDEKGDGAKLRLQELVDFSGLNVHSLRGRMRSLINNGYIVSEEVMDTENDKKIKLIYLTELGWEVDPDAVDEDAE